MVRASRSKAQLAVEISIRLPAILLFAYGLIVFADQTAGQLARHGRGYFVSPYIWASNVGWPTNGLLAFEGLLMALAGFFVLRLWSERGDNSAETPLVWPLFNALTDILILFFALCLSWEVLLSNYQPWTMSMQIIQFLAGTGISNTFVMNFSAISLAVLLAIRLRGSLFGWLSRRPTSKRLASNAGLSCLLLGAFTFAVAFLVGSSFNTLTLLSQPIPLACNEVCYFLDTLDLVGGMLGIILVGVGVIVSMERLFPRERIV